ncbi:MAG: serine/threonine protein kinase [Phycisphaerae bacterium]|nr:serine/threonine protein kinase [Phycisphaerae bacterium]
MACLTPEQIELLALDALAPDDAKTLHQHLQQCDKCRQAFDECRANEDVLGRLRRPSGPVLRTETSSDGIIDVDQPAGGAAEPRPDTNIGRRIGPYQIKLRIGAGGMGSVYLAARVGEFEQSVAIKLIKRGMDTDEILRRFRNERQVLASLKHPNIAQLLDGGTTDDGLPYFVMEYIDGLPIDRYCDRRKLDTLKRLRLLQDVCRAVHFAHQSTVIHRDLKPGNILVTADGAVKLVDFGVAKLMHREQAEQTLSLTAPHSRVMTPEYASPEQVRGEPLTTATDVYSLGVVMYELLTGHRPYTFSTHFVQEIERVISQNEPRRPSEVIDEWAELRHHDGSSSVLTPESVSATRDGDADKLRKRLRGDIDNIVLMALEKDPQRRYASVEQLSADIARFLNNEPVLAAPPSPTYRLRKFARRNSGLLSALGAIAAVLVFGLGLATYGFLDASRQRARADQKAVDAERERQNAVAQRDRAQAAEQRAKAEANRAIEEAAKAAAINHFLQDMLASVDPALARGQDVLVRDVLDAASESIDDSNLQPDVEAELRLTIGQTYHALGFIGVAEANYLKALELRTARFGRRHQATAVCLQELAHLARETGDYQQAVGLYRETLGILREAYVDDRAETAQCLNGLAASLHSLGQMDEAETLYREALAINRRLLAANDPLMASCISNLAVLLHHKGDHAAAEELYRKALEINRQAYGEDHPDVATCLTNLATLAKDRGDYAGAQDLYLQALDIRQQILEPDHPAIAETMSGLAAVLRARGELDSAEVMLREALDLQIARLGEDHPDVVLTRHTLATVLYSKGDLDGAEPLYRATLAAYRETLGDDHPYVAISLNTLGTLLTAKGDLDAAEPMFREAVEISRRAYGNRHRDVGENLDALAMLMYRRGELAEAETHFREARTILESALGPEHPRALITTSNLAIVLRAAGQYTEAEELLTKVLDARRQQLGDLDPSVAQTLLSLGTVLHEAGDDEGAVVRYRAAAGILRETHAADALLAATLGRLAEIAEQSGTPADADPLLKEAIDVAIEVYGPADPHTFTHRIDLGACLIRQERFADAEEQLRPVCEALIATVGAESEQGQAAIQQMVNLYEAWNRPTEAAAWREHLTTAEE